MAVNRFRLGWKRQEPDHRDWHYSVSGRITSQLPPKCNLSANMPPLLDQGDLGACGPNSADECLQYDERVQGMPVASASRLFIYWTARSLMPGKPTNEDSGVDNRSLLKALAKYGFCPESMWPYHTGNFRRKPSPACFAAALGHAIKSYAAVQKTLDQMRGCIASGFPFIFGFDVFESFMTDAVAATGVVPMPNVKTEQQVGGHDVTFFGYDDSTRMFKFRNHWVNEDGTPWGDQGNGYFPYDYATSNLASDFWAIDAVPGSSTKKKSLDLDASTAFSGGLTFENGLLLSVESASSDGPST